MINKYKFDEIAEIFTGIRVKRYQKGETIKQKVLKKTYEDSSQIEIEFEDVSYDIEGLPTGKYYLVEDIAPEGYEKSSEKIEIEITDAGAVKDKVVMINSPKKVPVPDTLSTKSAILLTISMIDVALGIGLLLYIKKNKILN